MDINTYSLPLFSVTDLRSFSVRFKVSATAFLYRKAVIIFSHQVSIHYIIFLTGLPVARQSKILLGSSTSKMSIKALIKGYIR